MADGDWGAGFFQNPACDACDDVVAETADVSFGDAWVEPYLLRLARHQRRRGPLPVVHAPHRTRRRADGRLALEPVDADFVAETQAAGFRHRREGLAYRLTWRASPAAAASRRGSASPPSRPRAAAAPPPRLPHPPRHRGVEPPGLPSRPPPRPSRPLPRLGPGGARRSTRASPIPAAASVASPTACCPPTAAPARPARNVSPGRPLPARAPVQDEPHGRSPSD